jgi:hypothetical protein
VDNDPKLTLDEMLFQILEGLADTLSASGRSLDPSVMTALLVETASKKEFWFATILPYVQAWYEGRLKRQLEPEK